MFVHVVYSAIVCEVLVLCLRNINCEKQKPNSDKLPGIAIFTALNISAALDIFALCLFLHQVSFSEY